MGHYFLDKQYIPSSDRIRMKGFWTIGHDLFSIHGIKTEKSNIIASRIINDKHLDSTTCPVYCVHCSY